MKNDHETRVKRSAERIADELPEHMKRWISKDDVAQDIAVMRLKYPQRTNGHNTQVVQRDLRAQGRRIDEPALMDPNTDMRPTETAIWPRMFWREVLRALHTPVTQSPRQEAQRDAFRIFKVLFRLHARGDSTDEIATNLDVTRYRIQHIARTEAGRLRGSARGRLIRPFLED